MSTMTTIIGYTRPEWDELRTAPELVTTVETSILGDATVYVEKAGGSTPGEAHAGRWNCEVHLDGEIRWAPIDCGLPTGHVGAAEIAVSFVEADIENETAL